MKYKYCKDSIRVKMSKTDYEELVHIISLAQEYHLKKSISDACDCAEAVWEMFIGKELNLFMTKDLSK